MRIEDAAKWNKRVSGVYALGVWTMISSYMYYKYTDRVQDGNMQEKSKEAQEPENPNQVVYQTDYTKTTIVYKNDFVPYTTRIYNFLKSFSGDPGTGEK